MNSSEWLIIKFNKFSKRSALSSLYIYIPIPKDHQFRVLLTSVSHLFTLSFINLFVKELLLFANVNHSLLVSLYFCNDCLSDKEKSFQACMMGMSCRTIYVLFYSTFLFLLQTVLYSKSTEKLLFLLNAK